MSYRILPVLGLLAITGCAGSPKICAPEQKRCAADGVVESCRADGESWLYYRDCAAGDRCVNGLCEPLLAGCGDASCDAAAAETCQSCPEDCGACCGNGTCEPVRNESPLTCPADCRATDGALAHDGGADAPGASDLRPAKDLAAPQLPPKILSLTVSPSSIGPGRSATVSAVVSDPNGLPDLAGGTLEDVSAGGSYGAFGTPGGQGTFSIAVSWAALHAMQPIVLPAGGGTRALRATFFDAAGAVASQTLQLGLRCPTSSDGVCNGACVNLQTSSKHCGACNTPVSSNLVCKNGVPTCPSGLTLCGGTCYDLKQDDKHCGSCTMNCDSYAKQHNATSVSMGCVAGVCAFKVWNKAGYSYDPSRTTCAALCGKYGLSCHSGDFMSTLPCWPGYKNVVGCGKYELPGCGANKPLGCTDDATVYLPPPNTCKYPTPYDLVHFACFCK